MMKRINLLLSIVLIVSASSLAHVAHRFLAQNLICLMCFDSYRLLDGDFIDF